MALPQINPGGKPKFDGCHVTPPSAERRKFSAPTNPANINRSRARSGEMASDCSPQLAVPVGLNTRVHVAPASPLRYNPAWSAHAYATRPLPGTNASAITPLLGPRPLDTTHV